MPVDALRRTLAVVARSKGVALIRSLTGCMALRVRKIVLLARSAEMLAVVSSLGACAPREAPAHSAGANDAKTASDSTRSTTSSEVSSGWIDDDRDDARSRAPSRTLFEQPPVVVREQASPVSPSRPPRVGLVDLDIQRADLANAARLLADAGRFNVVVEEGLSGSVTAQLRRVDPYQALVALAETHGAIVVYEDGIVLVRHFQSRR